MSHVAQSLLDGLGMLQQPGLLLQFLLLVLGELCRLQLVEKKLVVITCLVILGILCREAFQLMFQGRILAV